MHDYRPSGACMPWNSKERNHYEIGLLLTFLLTGLAGLLLQRDTSSNTLLTMPTELVYVWHGVSTIGGFVGLLGTILASAPRRWLVGNGLLRFGLGLIALQLSGYGLAVLGLFNLKALFVGLILLAFAWAAWSRIRKINRDMAEFRKAFLSQMEGVNDLGNRPPGGGDTRRCRGPDSSVADKEDEGRHQ